LRPLSQRPDERLMGEILGLVEVPGVRVHLHGERVRVGLVERLEVRAHHSSTAPRRLGSPRAPAPCRPRGSHQTRASRLGGSLPSDDRSVHARTAVPALHWLMAGTDVIRALEKRYQSYFATRPAMTFAVATHEGEKHTFGPGEP